MFGSRIEGTLGAAGHQVALAPSISEAPLGDADLLVADLENEPPEALVGLGVPVLGYYSHVKGDVKQAAEAAGVDLAVPRSRMAREMPALVERLLSRVRDVHGPVDDAVVEVPPRPCPKRRGIETAGGRERRQQDPELGSLLALLEGGVRAQERCEAFGRPADDDAVAARGRRRDRVDGLR